MRGRFFLPIGKTPTKGTPILDKLIFCARLVCFHSVFLKIFQPQYTQNNAKEGNQMESALTLDSATPAEAIREIARGVKNLAEVDDGKFVKIYPDTPNALLRSARQSLDGDLVVAFNPRIYNHKEGLGIFFHRLFMVVLESAKNEMTLIFLKKVQRQKVAVSVKIDLNGCVGIEYCTLSKLIWSKCSVYPMGFPPQQEELRRSSAIKTGRVSEKFLAVLAENISLVGPYLSATAKSVAMTEK